MIKTILNSTIALSSALLLTIILHELAHYAMSLGLGYDTTLYHNRVFTQSIGNVRHEILIAGIAPVFSLLQGVLSIRLARSIKTSVFSLFLLWFGVAGVITFFGYLMIAPLVPVGDTGKVFLLLGMPVAIQFIIAIIAVVAITFILIRTTSEFEHFAHINYGDTVTSRIKWSRSLILIPLLISIVISTIFQFPVRHFVSILATICAPFSIMAIFGTFIGRKNEIAITDSSNPINERLSLLVLGILILIIIVNRLLVNGV